MTTTGMTGDTDPANPVNNLPAWEFPVGAALTLAYGSNERPFCTLGNLYRIVGYLTGDVPPVDGQPADPDRNQPYIAGLADEIERCREHVIAQLPDELRAIDPPPPGGNETADVAWLAGIVNRYGPTIALDALPGTPNNPTPTGTDHDAHEPPPATPNA